MQLYNLPTQELEDNFMENNDKKYKISKTTVKTIFIFLILNSII